MTKLLALLSLASATQAAFTAYINGAATACNFVSQHNKYSTNTETQTESSLWVPNTFSGKYPTNYDLKYKRINSTYAEGGRCTTGVSAFGSSGIFQAHVYIHSTVINGTGVFTINAEPKKFNQSEELDLIVINVDNGIMKSGRPGSAASFNIASYQNKWINIHMTKSGSTCVTTISTITMAEVSNLNATESTESTETETVLAVGQAVGCTQAPESEMVVNARGRDGKDPTDSVVSIKYISWAKASLEEMAAHQEKMLAIKAELENGSNSDL